MAKKVFLGVGHGGIDAGAVANGLRESDLNLKQGLFLKEILENNGVIVGISRTRDENDDLSEEIRECNAFSPDLAVDLHTNAGGGKGFEVYRSIKPTLCGTLASNIDAEIRGAGLVSRGIKTRANDYGGDYFGFIREIYAPSIITEMAFIDNISDISNFDEDHEIRAYVTCLAKGILKTLGMSYGSGESKPINPTPSNYGVGSKIQIVGNTYSTGQTIPQWVKQNTYEIIQLNGSKALIGGIMSWVNISDLKVLSNGVAPSNPAPQPTTIAVGTKVQVIGSNYATGQQVPNWVKSNVYTITQVSGDRVLLSDIVSWVYIKDVKVAGSSTPAPAPKVCKVGSSVKITGNTYATGQAVPTWVKANTYSVIEMSSGKALLGGIMSWVNTKDLTVL